MVEPQSRKAGHTDESSSDVVLHRGPFQSLYTSLSFSFAFIRVNSRLNGLSLAFTRLVPAFGFAAPFIASYSPIEYFAS